MIIHVIIAFVVFQPAVIANRYRNKTKRRRYPTPKKSIQIVPSECIGIIEEVDYLDLKHDIRLMCQKDNGTRVMLSVTSDWIINTYKDGNFMSGVDIVEIPPGSEDHNGVIINPPGTDFVLKKNNENAARRHLAAVIGTRTVLAIRVVAADASTTSSLNQISDNVFGTGITETDTVNVKSQYSACSHGKLIFNPTADRSAVDPLLPAIANGVTETTITQNVVGATKEDVLSWVESALQNQFGVNPSDLADHVMFCLPAGTTPGWIAYAGVNSWYSAFNDVWCAYVSAQMHEIGHNINLDHSGEGTAEYDDRSCMMGYSYVGDDSPSMCFNGAKNWQLGWFDDRKFSLSPILDVETTHTLVGMVDYSNNPDGHLIILKVNTGSADDFYVSFNRKTSFNSDTMEGGDQVMVVEQGLEGSGFSKSLLLAKMSLGASYVASNFNGSGFSLTITITSIDTSVKPAIAGVSVCWGTCSTENPSSTPSLIPSSSPSSTPSSLPSLSPSEIPSLSFSPTIHPSILPTITISPSSTIIPTSSPSFNPSLSVSPSASATLLPSMTPSSSPSTLQSVNPTLTSIPTSFQTIYPSSGPSSTIIPTSSPTLAPSQSPSLSPTLVPSLNPTTPPTLSKSVSPTTTSSSSPTKEHSSSPSSYPTPVPSLGNQCSQYTNDWKLCKSTNCCKWHYRALKCVEESCAPSPAPNTDQCSQYDNNWKLCKSKDCCKWHYSTRKCTQSQESCAPTPAPFADDCSQYKRNWKKCSRDKCCKYSRFSRVCQNLPTCAPTQSPEAFHDCGLIKNKHVCKYTKCCKWKKRRRNKNQNESEDYVYGSEEDEESGDEDENDDGNEIFEDKRLLRKWNHPVHKWECVKRKKSCN